MLKCFPEKNVPSYTLSCGAVVFFFSCIGSWAPGFPLSLLQSRSGFVNILRPSQKSSAVSPQCQNIPGTLASSDSAGIVIWHHCFLCRLHLIRKGLGKGKYVFNKGKESRGPWGLMNFMRKWVFTRPHLYKAQPHSTLECPAQDYSNLPDAFCQNAKSSHSDIPLKYHFKWLKQCAKVALYSF